MQCFISTSLISQTWTFTICSTRKPSIYFFAMNKNPNYVTKLSYGCCFFFCSISSFFLKLFIHSSPVAYWAHTDFRSSIFHVISLPFHPVHQVLKARILKWVAIPFSSGPHLAITLHHDPSILGGPTQHGS